MADRMGAIRVRWGIGRMHYIVAPGLYALGNPDDAAPVIVTANYKLSFDHLRKSLPGRAAWVLVLDTKGINVWCAAGKGTFGTTELTSRLSSSGLAKLVKHRTLILPQLAAPGVAAYAVKKETGFSVVYGPVMAEDLPAFIDACLKATPEMRLKRFTAWERLVLIPVELVGSLKWFVFILPTVFLLGGLGGGEYWVNTGYYGLWAVFSMLTALLSGAVLTPLMLPVLPGRAFAVKGGIAGTLSALLLLTVRELFSGTTVSVLEIAAWLLLVSTVSSVLGMNFTGASTYTSLSGVKKEMRWAIPLQILASAIGLGLWLTSRFIA